MSWEGEFISSEDLCQGTALGWRFKCKRQAGKKKKRKGFGKRQGKKTKGPQLRNKCGIERRIKNKSRFSHPIFKRDMELLKKEDSKIEGGGLLSEGEWDRKEVNGACPARV